jgi:hypothetical protein
MTGISKWAVINGIWAAARQLQYVPDKVYLINRIGNQGEGELLTKWIGAYLRSQGKEPEIAVVEVDEGNFVSTGKRIAELIQTEKDRGNEVALETTPGRKAVVSSALIASRETKVDHIFYLYIEDTFMADKPYPMIPFQIQHIVDLEKGAWQRTSL